MQRTEHPPSSPAPHPFAARPRLELAGAAALAAGVAQRIDTDRAETQQMKAGPVETNTVEFALPAGETIQRTPEPQAAPAPVVQTVTAAPAPTGDGGAALPTDLDELARRLYGPLEARLKTELWLDRERAGLITEVRR